MKKIFNPTLITNVKYYYLTIPDKADVYNIEIISKPVSKKDIKPEMLYVEETDRYYLELAKLLVKTQIDALYNFIQNVQTIQKGKCKHFYINNSLKYNVLKLKVAFCDGNHYNKNIYTKRDDALVVLASLKSILLFLEKKI